MISKEFIVEAPGKERIANWIKIIKQDCQPYLREVGPDPFKSSALYRGMADDGLFTTKDVRLSGRIPYDTPAMLHNIANEFFTKNFGSPFRDAMFCTGSFGSAMGYGEHSSYRKITYVIFPIGDFKYIWSPEVFDMYPEIIEPLGSSGIGLETRLKDAMYQTTDLRNAIDSDHEIMIRCKSYYAMNAHFASRNSKELSEMLTT